MKITVLMPVYNGAPYLRQAIDSVLRQQSVEFELLAIDDASTDNSREILLTYQSDARVRVVSHPKNIGLSATLNEGLRLAQGDYIARLDQDDEALPDRLRRQAEFLDQNAAVVLVGGQVCNMGATPELDRPVDLPQAPTEIREQLPKQNCLYHPSVMFRRTAVLEIGGYRSEFRNAEDYDLWLRLSQRGDFVNLPDPVIRYRLTTSGMSYSRRWEQLRYVLLAQESHRNPTAPLNALWPDVDARLAKFDRINFFDCVARHAVTELHALGFQSEAKRMLSGFDTELSAAARHDLTQLIAPASTPCVTPLPEPPTDNRSDFRPSAHATNSGFIQSVLAAALLLIPSVVWVWRDQHVWPWDQAWYGEVSVDLWWTLRHAPQNWWHEMIAAFGIKAPGLAWIGQFFVPLGHWLGSVELGLFAFVLLTQAATLMLFFQIGTRLWQGDHRGGWLAAALGGSAPLFISLSHQFLVEPLQVLGVTAFFWLALAGAEYGRVLLLAGVLGAASTAMLAKATSPLYCILPGLLVLVHFRHAKTWFGGNEIKRRLIELACLGGALGMTIASLRWYWQNQQTLRDFIQLASSSEVALQYGSLPVFSTKFRYWLRIAREGAFMPYVSLGLLAVVLVTWVTGRRSSLPAPPARWLRLVMWTGLLELALVLVTFTRQINEEARYMLPALPAWLVVTVFALGRGRRDRACRLGLGLAIVQWGWSHAVAAGLTPSSQGIIYWLLPTQPDPGKKAEVSKIVQTTTSPAIAYHYNINVYEADWLNANSLAFYAAKHRLDVGIRCYYTSLGYGATDLEAAWARVQSMQAVGIIGLAPDRQPQPPNFLNQIAVPFLTRVQASPEFRPQRFESAKGVLLYQRSTEPR